MAYNSDFQGPWPVGATGVASYPGVYRVEARSLSSGWSLLYIGESGNIEDRIARHEKYDDWRRATTGSLHFFAKKIESKDRRRQEEQDMIHRFRPPCNFQFSTSTDARTQLRVSAVQEILSEMGSVGESVPLVDARTRARIAAIRQMLSERGSAGRPSSSVDSKTRARAAAIRQILSEM